jgi:two-component system NtrC family sensor kinase
VIEGHGGVVKVISAPDAGATFTITLPVMPAEDLLDELLPVPVRGRLGAARVGRDHSAPVRGRAPGVPAHGASILLVEDKPEVATMLTDMLSIDGHRVETAADGLRALDKLSTSAYDVVITDVRMPGLDGPGLYEQLRRRHPRLDGRVIFCTGESLSPDVQAILDAMQAPVITKPFAVEDLRRALRDVLTER